jgi:hypothetical protein
MKVVEQSNTGREIHQSSADSCAANSNDLRLTITATLACSKSGKPSFIFNRVCLFLLLRFMVSRLPTVGHETAQFDQFFRFWTSPWAGVYEQLQFESTLKDSSSHFRER